MRRLLLLIALAAAPAAAGAQAVVTSERPQGVAVTVYRDPGRGSDQAMDLDMLNGFALVSERRRVRVPAGESVIRFEGVAAGIVPQSAMVSGFPDGIVERNRDAYLLSPATLVDRSLGRRVHLRRTSRATGEVRDYEADILSSAAGALVVRTADGIETLRCTGLPETIVYDEVPADLSSRPTLSVRTRSSAPVEAVVTLSYLATGFDWQANYIAQLSDDERRLDLFAWLTLGSSDETSFPNADTQAVAGRLNYTRAAAEPPEGPPLNLQCWVQRTTSDIPLLQHERRPPSRGRAMDENYADADTVTVTGSRISHAQLSASAPVTVIMAQQEELGDLKLYRIPEPVTVAANAQKQVALLRRESVRVETVYRARLAPDSLHDARPAVRTVVTRNEPRQGLGLPLPSGGVVLFAQARGRPILIGEGYLYDRAVGDDVEIEFGQSASVFTQVTAEHNQRDNILHHQLKVTNAQPRAVTFEAEFMPDQNLRFLPARILATRDGRPLWRVSIPANSSVTFTYGVQRLDD